MKCRCIITPYYERFGCQIADQLQVDRFDRQTYEEGKVPLGGVYPRPFEDLIWNGPA